MGSVLLLAGLGVSLGGAVVVAVADAMFSRSVLVYLDAIESNVGRLVQAVRSGSKELLATEIDRARDRGQNQARALKMLGWLALVAGFALQLAACAVTTPA